MTKLAKIALLSTVCVWLALGVALAKPEIDIFETLKYERVHLVDVSDQGHLLFRGNEPRTDDGFAYDMLVKYMKMRAAEQNVTFPEEFELVDISFLSFELRDQIQEAQFFRNNPQLGRFIAWPLFGSLVPPKYVPLEPLRKAMAEKVIFWLDKLPERLQQLRTLFTTPANKPQVLYFHCEAGCDRTGYFAGAYMMQYMGTDINATWARNVHDCTRDPNFLSKNSLQWFCYYLKYQQGSNANCDL